MNRQTRLKASYQTIIENFSHPNINIYSSFISSRLAHTSKPYDLDDHIDYLDGTVHFDDTCQVCSLKQYFYKTSYLFLKDVLSIIGSPNSVYYKTDDKIKIHNLSLSSSVSQRARDKSDFYYNYVNYGLV